MTGAESLAIMRHRLNDLEDDPEAQVYPDSELLAYLNVCIFMTANEMNLSGIQDNIKTLEIPANSEIDIPADFSSFIPGMPCFLAEGKIRPDPHIMGNAAIFYFSIPGEIALDDQIPLSHAWGIKAIHRAVEMAGLRTGHDTTLDATLHNSLSGGGQNAQR